MSTVPTTWRPCTQQEHLDELRVRHEDATSHPYDRGAHERLSDAVGGYLEHLDGLHADLEMLVWPMTAPPPRPPLEPDIYERRRAMGVWD